MRRMVLFLTGALMLCSCIRMECENDKVVEVPSPDGTLKAVRFRRSCGATTGFSTQVSLLSAADRLPDDGGNVLIIRDDRNLALQWHGNHQLKISGVGFSETFKQEAELRGVKITYER